MRPAPKPRHPADQLPVSTTMRAHCQKCRGERVFYLQPPTKHVDHAVWVCFACLQPRGGKA